MYLKDSFRLMHLLKIRPDAHTPNILIVASGDLMATRACI